MLSWFFSELSKMMNLRFIFSKTLFHFDVPRAMDVAILLGGSRTCHFVGLRSTKRKSCLLLGSLFIASVRGYLKPEAIWNEIFFSR